MGSIKEKAMFAASVCAVIAAVWYVQEKHFKIPVVGAFLPGGR